MNETQTTERPADAQETTGHGKHRGPVASDEGQTAPRGRHRKQPAEQTGSAA